MSAADQDQDRIVISRSDNKGRDLTMFTKENGVLHEILSAPEVTAEAAPEQEPISIRRSDGKGQDLIKVFKSRSEKDTSIFARFTFKSKAPQLESQSEEGITTISDYSPGTLRIVHMSDTHNFLVRSTTYQTNFLPAGDILIHSGNFTNDGLDEEFEVFDDWLASVSDIYRKRVVVLGDRDVRQVGNNWEEAREKLPHATHVLCHSEACVFGLRIYGCPWHFGHAYNYSMKSGYPSVSNRFLDIPDNINVLVTHGPAHGRLDTFQSGDVSKNEHTGSQDLTDAIRRVRPGLHLHGHIHDSRGVIAPVGPFPLTLNSTMCDKDARVMYACAQVVKATQLHQDSAGGSTICGGGGGSTGGAPPARTSGKAGSSGAGATVGGSIMAAVSRSSKSILQTQSPNPAIAKQNSDGVSGASAARRGSGGASRKSMGNFYDFELAPLC